VPTADRTELTEAEERIDALVRSGAPLAPALEEIVRVVEQLTASGMIASILVLDEDGRHLRHGAGPSLPDSYNAAIDGLQIGPDVGSCGTAAHTGRPVAVYDIENDALWKDFKGLALQHGLRACWSTPIPGADGRVLGTFANYYRVVRDPSPVDLELTMMVTRLAAHAIERSRPPAG
jgi:GAF domain-containing protein